MEPDRKQQQQSLAPSAAQKPKRFRIIKLEDRIAPAKGGNGTNNCPASQGKYSACYTCVGCPW